MNEAETVFNITKGFNEDDIVKLRALATEYPENKLFSVLVSLVYEIKETIEI